MSTVPEQPQAADPSDVAAEETSPVSDEAVEAAPTESSADPSADDDSAPSQDETTEEVAAEGASDTPEGGDASDDSEVADVTVEAPEPEATGPVLMLDPDDDSEDEVLILDADFSADPSSDSDDVLILDEDDGPSPDEVRAVELEARVAGLEAELEAAQAEAGSFKTRLLRTTADYENFRRRTTKEKDDLEKFAAQRVVREFLPVIDNLERALQHAGDDEEVPKSSLREGVDMVMKQFRQSLEKQGVVGFDSAGEMFDPQVHEAIQQIDTDEHPTGTIVNEFQRGYHIHDKLLRPALVVVARNTSEEA